MRRAIGAAAAFVALGARRIAAVSAAAGQLVAFAIGWRDDVLAPLAARPSLPCYGASGHFTGRGMDAGRGGRSPLGNRVPASGSACTGAVAWHLGTMARRHLIGPA